MAMVILLVVMAIGIWFVVIYNGLVRYKNQVHNAFAQIDVQLKRRHDLIPNLVAVAKGYMAHETDTLDLVIKARQQAMNINATDLDTSSLAQMAQVETYLSSALSRLYAVVENYPELKADTVMRDLFDEITHTENRIGFARQHYNDSVMFYNNQREVFPNNLISSWSNFLPMSMLEFEDKSVIKQAVGVDFSR